MANNGPPDCIVLQAIVAVEQCSCLLQSICAVVNFLFLQITRETFTYVLHIVALPELTRYIAIDYILIFARNVWHS